MIDTMAKKKPEHGSLVTNSSYNISDSSINSTLPSLLAGDGTFTGTYVTTGGTGVTTGNITFNNNNLTSPYYQHPSIYTLGNTISTAPTYTTARNTLRIQFNHIARTAARLLDLDVNKSHQFIASKYTISNNLQNNSIKKDIELSISEQHGAGKELYEFMVEHIKNIEFISICENNIEKNFNINITNMSFVLEHEVAIVKSRITINAEVTEEFYL